MAAGVAALAAGIAVSLSGAAPAQAYCATSNSWPGSILLARIGPAVPAAWDTAIKKSMKQWNNIPSANWTIKYTASTDAHIKVGYSTPNGGFPGMAPGVTKLQVNSSGQIVGGNVFLNPAFSWNLNGNLNQANQVADVRTITTHELGHELRLTHPANCGTPMTAAEKASAMNPNYKKKWTINSDDKAGAAYMK